MYRKVKGNAVHIFNNTWLWIFKNFFSYILVWISLFRLKETESTTNMA